MIPDKIKIFVKIGANVPHLWPNKTFGPKWFDISSGPK